MANASRDDNSIPTLIGASSADGKTPVKVYANPTTHRLLVDNAGSGAGSVTEVDTGTGLTGGPITTTGTIALDSKLAPLDTLGTAAQSIRVNAGATALEYYTPTTGTVTSVSVASANGFAGTVANSTTTPAITMQTSITGILKGNGTAISAATAGTDYTNLAFKTIAVSGQSNIVAGTAEDTLTLAGGTNITITTNAGTNTATITASAASDNITVAATTITSGTSTRILYDNAGVLGEYTVTGTGTTAVLSTSPTFTTSLTSPLIIGGSGTTGTQLTLQTTTGNGTTDALVVKGGNNGGTIFATFTTGALTIGTSGVFTTGTIELGAASDTTLSRSSAGVLAVEGVVIPSISSTNTLTNKRITRRLTTVNAPGATPTTNTDNVDVQNFTGLNTAITSMTSSLSGTPVDGDLLEFRFTDDGTGRAITWDTSFESTTVTLPTTTVASTMLRVGFEWNAAASKWDCVAIA